MNWMVRYQSNNNGLLEIYFDDLQEAIDWQTEHNGELWQRIYS